ncbi:hypothetical protein RB2501_07000 [Robiginitalea biformata HTCC2501]|uniref:Uncharacterized protein n=1 Tax=Robiginitalea biformata (strain ATCC BAA-864 / DSM 15991 / KCTC 12146 / HTCC2501) TaxID=313596 RepID=A4CI70_ROBBH|nr:hypothetical protein RB2501_07000 [Robiginitalea biformata HTCC2501]
MAGLNPKSSGQRINSGAAERNLIIFASYFRIA